MRLFPRFIFHIQQRSWFSFVETIKLFYSYYFAIQTNISRVHEMYRYFSDLFHSISFGFVILRTHAKPRCRVVGHPIPVKMIFVRADLLNVHKYCFYDVFHRWRNQMRIEKCAVYYHFVCVQEWWSTVRNRLLNALIDFYWMPQKSWTTSKKLHSNGCRAPRITTKIDQNIVCARRVVWNRKYYSYPSRTHKTESNFIHKQLRWWSMETAAEFQQYSKRKHIRH